MIGEAEFRRALYDGKRTALEMESQAEWLDSQQIEQETFAHFVGAMLDVMEEEGTDDGQLALFAFVCFQVGWDLRGQVNG